MQVSVETTGSLERSMTVEVPEERISTEVASRLKSLTKTTRVQGFRPGKAPLRVIKQRFAGKVRREVIGELVQSSFYEAITQENLRPAGDPMFDPLQADLGQGLSYTARFEIMPEVKLGPIEELEFDRPVCDINDEDVNKMIDVLRERRRQPEEVERNAKAGDVVNIDFEGLVEGQTFAGGSGEAVQVEIGKKQLLEGFEDGLIGASKGDALNIKLKFPDNYHKEELADKPVTFEIKVNSVSELVKPELDDAFFQGFGVSEGGEEAFRKEISRHMQRESEVAIRSRRRDSVMQALHDTHEIELPKTLVDGEIHRMQHQFTDNLKARGIPVEDHPEMPEPGMFEEQARRRVALRLLVGELIREHELKASPEKVREIIEKNAQSYEDPSAMINWYYSDRHRLAEIEAVALEDEVVDWISNRAKAKEFSLSFDELMNKGQTASN